MIDFTMAIKRLEKKARWLLLAFVIAASISVVNAALFVYYEVRIYAQGQIPPVIFAPGKSANGTDLWGYPILVSFDSTNTSLTITVHPTYRTHFYKNITLIVNRDSNIYYLAFNVTKAFTESKIAEAKLIIRDVNKNKIAEINLKATGLQEWSIELSGGGKLTIDLYLKINPGSGNNFNNPPFSSDNAELQLIYSPQNAEHPED